MRTNSWAYFLFCLFLFLNSGFGAISVFRYEEEPNEGDHVIEGFENGAQFLSPFQYVIEVSNEPLILSSEGEVEVAFYNQFGQILHVGEITHPPFNNPTNPELLVRSPNLPMLEGRTQLLAWAREADGRPVFIEIPNPPGTFNIPIALNNGAVTCVPAAAGGNCTVTFTPPAGAAVVISVPAGPAVPAGADFPANTAVAVTGATASSLTTVTGETGPTPWFFGPHVFQEGVAQGDFIFIDTDQGPPASPFINHFRCQGTPNCIDAPLLVEVPRGSTDPLFNRFRYTVVFNKLDLFNATNSAGTGVPLTLEYSGFVFNNPSLFGQNGLPGAIPKPESNAFVDSNLFAVQFSSSINPEIARKTTITGPYAISVQVGTPGTPQVTYPDEDIAFPYNSPIYPSETPFPVKYPFGPSLAPGLYQTFTYNFTAMLDGDYEIWASSDDFLAALTRNGQSPGSLLPSGQRVAGTTTVIQVIRDTLPPNSFEVSFDPPQPFLIVGDQEEPPMPYTTYQAEVFRISGRVDDERNDENTVQVDLRRDDGLLVTRAGKNGHFEQIPTFAGNFTQIIDVSPEDPDSTASPSGPHPAIGGQRGYQMLIYPTDPQLNTSETTRALYLIKDLEPPQNPIFVLPSVGVGIVTSTILQVEVESSNAFVPSLPFLDLREHGSVEMELFVIDSSGQASRFTTLGQGNFSTGASASSSLDNDPSWNVAPSPLGGQGLTGVDFFGDVPDSFTFRRRINLNGFVDGPIDLIVRLFDQVGNPSALTTSVSFVKDSTGPQIIISDQDREESGPDNNYPGPNQLGADNDQYVISLISPELTVDNGPGAAAPQIPDPGNADTLILKGRVVDGITRVDRVELTSAHVSNLVSDVSGLNVTDAAFEFQVDVTAIPESVREVIQLRGFDENNIGGAVRSIEVMRDVEPGRSPNVIEPALIATTGKHQIYTSADRIRIRGQLDSRDAVEIEGLPSADFFAKAVVLTPSTAPGSFVTGQAVPRLPRSSPQSIPREDSFFRSFPSTSTVASYFVTRPDEEGSFDLEVPITHFPANPSIPTTIWVQAIDALDNTDPSQAVPVEVFYLPDGAPVASLSLVDFFGLPGETDVFPPVSLPPSLLTSLFTPIEPVRLRLRTFVPMIQAPVLELSQFGSDPLAAEVLTAVGTTDGATQIFDYLYSVRSRPGQFDGQVAANIFGGVDLFGQPVQSSSVTTVFYVDSLAPNVVTTGPDFVQIAIQPDFQPVQGQRLNQSNFIVAVNFNDFLPSNGSLDRSGVDTSALSLTVNGPLAVNPESAVVIIPVTPPAGFDLAVRVPGLLQDGVYRIAAKGQDRVGNRRTFYSNFVMDSTPIAQPLILTNPTNNSVISRFPETGSQAFVDLIVERLDVDIQASDFQLFDPFGQNVELTTTTVLSLNQKRKFLVSVPPYDGTSDGNWRIEIEALDQSGNTTSRIHTFLLDSLPPIAGGFFPSRDLCVGPVQNIMQVNVSDPVAHNLAVPSGLHPSSGLSLALTQSFSIPPDPWITGPLQGESKVLSVTGNGLSGEFQVAFLPTQGGQNQPLIQDGSRDGVYDLKAVLVDNALNQREILSGFRYDSQAPTIRLSDLSENFLKISTGGLYLDLSGFVMDDGPCHFDSQPPFSNAGPTLSLSLNFLDVDNQVVGASLLNQVEVTSLSSMSPPSFPYHQSQKAFSYVTFVPGLPLDGNYRLKMESRDKAGNQRIEERDMRVIQALDAVPRLLNPPEPVDGELPVLKNLILDFGWQPIAGRPLVEVRVDRLNLASSPEVYRATFPMSRLSSGSVAILPGTTLSSRENFEIFIRSIDPKGLSSPWSSPRTVVVDPLPFRLENLWLLSGGQRKSLATSGVIISTATFQVEAEFSKSYVKTAGMLPRFGFFKVGLEGQDTSVKSVLPATSTTSRTLTVTVQIPVSQTSPLPRADVICRLSDFRDDAAYVMEGREFRAGLDLGPDAEIRLFVNPADPKEVIAVARFVSSRQEPVEVPVTYTGSVLSLPRFELIRDRGNVILSALSIGERTRFHQKVASTFSVPLIMARDQPGWYVFRAKGKDLDGREILRDLEVRIGTASLQTSLSLEKVGPVEKLSIGAGLGEGLVFAGGGLIPLNQRQGELQLRWDARIFGSAPGLHGATASIRLNPSVSKMVASTWLGWYRQEQGELKFAAPFQEGVAQVLTLGHEYVLAEDLVQPEIHWEGESYLASGWQELPVQIEDQGSGVAWEQVRILLGESKELKTRIQGEKIQVELPKTREIKEETMILEASDRAGQKQRFSQSVTLLGGEGLEWIQTVPNPVRGNFASFRYLANEPARNLKIQIYDTAGGLIQILEASSPAGPGRRDWDLRSRLGTDVANGVYLYRARFESISGRIHVKTGKLAILR